MSDVISDQQLDLNRTLHANDTDFGSRPDAGGLTARLHKAIIKMHDCGLCSSVVDYGTGKGALVSRLRDQLPGSISVYGYDPAVKQYKTKPAHPVDILTCIDVLEHVELPLVDTVLRDIDQLTAQFCLLMIDLQPSVKTLADGRNAHIMLAPHDWWLNRISSIFPNFATFVIPHKSGIDQKLVVVASRKRELSPAMYSFLSKLNIFSMVMAGGLPH